MSDPATGNAGDFFNRFLEDYFAECDEHLAMVRRGLLALERFVQQPHVDKRLLDELFRSFHTLKGISAMVGLADVEQLAHGMESYLRVLRDVPSILTEEGLDTLIASVTLLAEVIEAHRAGSPAPDIAAGLSGLAAVGHAPSQSLGGGRTDAAGEDQQLAAAPGDGRRTWRFEFVPGAALAERGINVGWVRTQLRGIGEILKASPQVRSQGDIAFEFIVASSAEESAFAAWREEGLTYSPAPEASSPVTPPLTIRRQEDSPTAGFSLGSPRTQSSVVRVDLERLNELIVTTGDLVMTRARLEGRIKQLHGTLPPAEWRDLEEISVLMGKQLRNLRQGVMRVRMVPVGEIFERMRFIIRDLARDTGKKVRLDLSGQETEIDKFLVERMMDPLVHLVRNAVGHGLESVEERVRQGKSSEGCIGLRASTAGEMVVIEVEDDGRGIDVERVAARARELGLLGPDAKMDEAALFEIISTPSFSTREQADRESGRGVGLDVVKNTVRELKGSVTVGTKPGRGTQFRIELPLTLAVANVLLAIVAKERFAVPQSVVREVIEVEPGAVKHMENNEILSYRGTTLPIIRLAKLFGLSEAPGQAFHVFVIQRATHVVGLAVDQVLGQREVVVRAVSDSLVKVPGIAGATEVGDGRVVLILDVPELLAAASNMGNRARLPLGAGRIQ